MITTTKELVKQCNDLNTERLALQAWLNNNPFAPADHKQPFEKRLVELYQQMEDITNEIIERDESELK